MNLKSINLSGKMKIKQWEKQVKTTIIFS